MILVTVGMQLGFDRLIEAMDVIAPRFDLAVVAQTGRGSYKPRAMEHRERIAPAEFEELVRQASVIVSHAGIGTVMTAQRHGKPVVLIPRRADLGEHRNDHQMATVRNLVGRSGIFIAFDENELFERIDQALAAGRSPSARSPSVQNLQAAVTRFIETGAI